jgi:hypothetical protein
VCEGSHIARIPAIGTSQETITIARRTVDEVAAELA